MDRSPAWTLFGKGLRHCLPSRNAERWPINAEPPGVEDAKKGNRSAVAANLFLFSHESWQTLQ
jgi:hypothetical protein